MSLLGENQGYRSGGRALTEKARDGNGSELDMRRSEAPVGRSQGSVFENESGADARPVHWPGSRSGQLGRSASGLGRIFSTCSNPECSSGWLHLWRSRTAPVFEGGWSCTADCTTAQVSRAVRREMDGRRTDSGGHRHRVPLGLVMLEQGWITSEQLRQALDSQKTSGEGRLGNWLIRQVGVPELLVTRALGLQWSCPVLALDYHDAEGLAPLMPRLFVDAFGALPLRVAAGRILYFGFEDRLDPVLALGVERMMGLHVETGLVRSSVFRSAHQRMLKATFPRTELLEASSEPTLARVLSKAIERAKPIESRLVRIHDCLWLRMWIKPQDGPVPQTQGLDSN